MEIGNLKYINLNIESNLYYYYLIENVELFNKFNINNIDNIKCKVLKKFFNHLEEKYKCKIKNIEDFKWDYIYYEIEIKNVLFDLIEEVIY